MNLRRDFACIDGNQFIVANCGHEPDEKTRAWIVNVGTKWIERLGEFDCPRFDQIESTTDGGFVVLGNNLSKQAMSHTVAAFDKKGKRLWELEHNYSGGPAALFSPKAIAVTTNGDVAVLDVIKHTVQFFDKRGGYRRTVKLADAWGRPANYPSSLSADIDGGVIVGDFNGKFPVVRMKADDSISQEFQQQFADGVGGHSLPHPRVAPDGKLWTTDGHALLRLNDKGIVDHIVGDPPDANRLTGIGGLSMDFRGRFLAIDAQPAPCISSTPRGDIKRSVSPNRPISPKCMVTRLSHPTATFISRGDNNTFALTQMDRVSVSLHASTTTFLRIGAFSRKGSACGSQRMKGYTCLIATRSFAKSSIGLMATGLTTPKVCKSLVMVPLRFATT